MNQVSDSCTYFKTTTSTMHNTESTTSLPISVHTPVSDCPDNTEMLVILTEK